MNQGIIGVDASTNNLQLSVYIGSFRLIDSIVNTIFTQQEQNYLMRAVFQNELKRINALPDDDTDNENQKQKNSEKKEERLAIYTQALSQLSS